MNADTLDAYRHSGKFNPLGILLAVAAAALLSLPLGLAYSYLLRWIPFVYVNVLATFGYGSAFGWVTARLLKAGHVRNLPLAAVVGLAAGLFALYGEWSGHLHTLFDDGPWVFLPGDILRVMPLLYDKGSWSFHGSNVTGIPLAIVWLAEAGIILGMAMLLPYTFVRETPYCEKTRCWLDEEKKINSLGRFTDPAHLAALQAGDIMPITQASPKVEGASVFTRLLLKRSAKCPVFCTLRVQDVAVSFDNKGNVKEKVADLTRDLIIPASMFDLIARFEEFKPGPPAGTGTA